MAGTDGFGGRTNPDDIFLLDSLRRLATFRLVGHHETPVLPSSLAESGFSVIGDGSFIKCVACLNSVSLFGVTTDPSDKCYHAEKCPFATAGDQRSDEGYGAESDLEADGLEASVSGAQVCSGMSDSIGLPPSSESKSVGSLSHHTSYPNRSLVQNAVNQSVNDVISPPNFLGATSSLIESKEFLRDTASPNGEFSDYSSDCSEYNFFDSDSFTPECSEEKMDSHQVDRNHCNKNPGHYAYFPASSITLPQIPASTRHPDVIKILQLCSDLTVKISLSHISKYRAMEDGVPRTCSTPRYGTGFMQDEPKEIIHNESSIKKLVPFLSKGKKCEIYIRTNRHLIIDRSEAEKSVVEFTYKQNNTMKTMALKGKELLVSKTPGNNSVILVCTSSDQDFIKRIVTTRNQIMELTANLPRRVKEALTKKLFIIHHPHGREKIISYGDSVMVKYLMDQPGSGRKGLNRINGQSNLEPDAISQNRVRKALLYAADTCPGSSGAPVLTFRANTSSIGRGQELDFEIWMHNGADIGTGLGGSIMKVYNLSDYELENRAGQSTSTQPSQDDDDDDNSTGDKHVTSPVFKVLSHSAYPVYIPYKKRLESFSDWKYHDIHHPEVLALAGFFYAGYADCVRCFQCGLGLRSWKPGDDVYGQHEKHRPNCPFLQNQIKNGGNQAFPNDSCLNCSEENIAVKLLKNESTKLEEQMKCKVCFKSQVKDLFLPCGELYACSDCSKLLTHCPSCNKQILATVSTFFT